jgi:hypothetical protein
MKKWALLKAFLLLLGLAASLFLAFGALSIETNLDIRTPGLIVWQFLARGEVSPGFGMGAQLLVDWIFWFAVLYLIYFVGKKLLTSLSKRFNQ